MHSVRTHFISRVSLWCVSPRLANCPSVWEWVVCLRQWSDRDKLGILQGPAVEVNLLPSLMLALLVVGCCCYLYFTITFVSHGGQLSSFLSFISAACKVSYFLSSMLSCIIFVQLFIQQFYMFLRYSSLLVRHARTHLHTYTRHWLDLATTTLIFVSPEYRMSVLVYIQPIVQYSLFIIAVSPSGEQMIWCSVSAWEVIVFRRSW